MCVLSFLICQSRATPPGVCRRSLQSALETRADSFVPEPDHFCGRPPLRRRSPGVVSRLRKPTTTLRTTASTTRFVQTSYRQQQEKKDFEYMPAVPASLLPRVKKSGVRRGGREMVLWKLLSQTPVMLCHIGVPGIFGVKQSRQCLSCGEAGAISTMQRRKVKI